MIHSDGLVEINLNHPDQLDNDDADDDDYFYLEFAESVGVWNQKRLISNKVLGPNVG